MRLKRTGTRTRALLWVLLALALDAYQGIVAWHLVTAGQWSWLQSTFVVMLVLFVPLWIAFLALLHSLLLYFLRQRLRIERVVRAAAEHDGQRAPTATIQPDQARALASGETLTLEIRRVKSGGFLRGAEVYRNVFMPLLIAYTWERVMFLFLPGLGYSNFNIFSIPPLIAGPPPAPSPLDWACAVFAGVLGILCFVGLMLGNTPRWERIHADDTGITLAQARRRRSHFISWSDISVFLRTEERRDDTPRGTYLLQGQRHALALTLHGEAPITKQQERRKTLAERLEYPGGYERYTEDARRLLATITVRSMVALRVSPRQSTRIRRVGRLYPLASLDTEDILALPAAPASLQPTAATIERARVYSGELRLRARLPWLRVWLAAAPVGVFGVLFMYPWLTLPAPPLGGTGVSWVALFTLAISIPSFLGMGVLVGFAWYRQRLPVVVADERGLVRKGGQPSPSFPQDIPWEVVRTWVLVPPPPGSKRPPYYVVFADERRVGWPEPPDAKLAGRGVHRDRRAAYQERAELLHALITARTGQPLRIIAATTFPAGE